MARALCIEFSGNSIMPDIYFTEGFLFAFEGTSTEYLFEGLEVDLGSMKAQDPRRPKNKNC
jgi:hypothetical protein